ncbi:winged helix-turn-helix domain-containing protein [Desulfoluna butyratoxydans]|uniref:Winged helix-turn-helix dna-binding domain n=1 Tax=Desulfoluna butyratoxydans TaxID=231438 RepID=A0A4U8YSG3_9BACT|nr:winged helix-turn-helix domain-containing protein [Desulfoluna butyratoxydans]VFQ47306.1 winged helix-turn-helix dna-binding domain [Desulfoluna butyratoxydans]
MSNLLSGIIGSKTRIKLLVRLFFNPDTHSYLRELASEFGLSTNAVREELNQLSQADLLTSSKNGRQIHYAANRNHPLFPELRSMVRKAIGVDQIIDSVVTRLGDLEAAYLIDDYAEGKDTGIIDLVLVGDIDPYHLNDLSRKTERYINRKLRSLVLSREEFEDFHENLEKRPMVLVWESAPQINLKNHDI